MAAENNILSIPDDYMVINTIKAAKHYCWSPAEDITAHELALCIPVLMSNGYRVDIAIEGLPEKARRHFQEM